VKGEREGEDQGSWLATYSRDVQSLSGHVLGDEIAVLVKVLLFALRCEVAPRRRH
jgi:hypothetical protein